ncbi:MAG: type II toxin-antitoxin system HicB family antitoxin [Pseudomonadota bacterium]
MKKTAKEYLKEPYSRVLVPESDGTYSADILEFPGCFAEGQTPNEAYANLEKIAESWIEAALEQGQEIPSPLETHDFSGRSALRIPRSIHKQAAKFAEMDGTSLNQFFLTAIAARVGAEDFFERLFNRLEAKFMTFATSMPSFTFNFHSALNLTAPQKMVTTQGFTFALPDQLFIPLAPDGLQMTAISGKNIEEGTLNG